jgi:hypothetical protein
MIYVDKYFDLNIALLFLNLKQVIVDVLLL